MLKKVLLYTDGSCFPNPGKGGWAYILKYGNHSKVGSGYSNYTTNNRMELAGVIEGLSCLNEPCEVNVYSDSQYVCKAFNEHWIDGWIKNGWKSSTGAVKNFDLWQDILKLSRTHKLHFIWVKGHASNDLNNRCDEFAKQQSGIYTPTYDLKKHTNRKYVNIDIFPEEGELD